MSIERLVEMANDIGAYFDVERDDTVAIDGIRGHIKRFWEPRMRRRLLDHIDGGGGDELAPRVRAAVTGLAAPPARRPLTGTSSA